MLARNSTAFATKYGTAPFGVFADSLNNGGEQITLSLGGATALRSFTCDNKFPWPTTPDNGGASLVLISPHTNPDHGNALNWRASAAPNPGSTDTSSYAAWKTTNGITGDFSDTDQDGLTALVEYALGGNPAVSSQTPLPALALQPDGSALLTFSRPLTADGVAWVVQTGSDLTGWLPDAGSVAGREQSGAAETWSWRIPAASSSGQRKFWRHAFTLR